MKNHILVTGGQLAAFVERETTRGYTGFKNVAFRASVVSAADLPHYKGKTICYENGRRLWQKTSAIYRLNRVDALLDAQNLAKENEMRTYHIAAPYFIAGHHNVDGLAIAAEMNKNIADDDYSRDAVEAELQTIPKRDAHIFGLKIIATETGERTMTTYKLSLPNDYQSEEDCVAMTEAEESYEEIAIAAKGAGMKYIRETDYGAEWEGTEAQFLECIENLPEWAKRYTSKVEK